MSEQPGVIRTRARGNELLAQARMALAEVGYTDSSLLTLMPDPNGGGWRIAMQKGGVPDEVIWQVGRVLRRPATLCLACWKARHPEGSCLDTTSVDCGRGAA